MAATSAVDHSWIRQAAPALKNITTSRVTELFKKVDWALVFGVTLAASYLFYHLLRFGQFFSHSALGLDESLRLVKCKALLDEAREKAGTTNVEPQLLKCEILLDSITDEPSSSDKQPVVLKLALQHVNKNPNRAYQIAQQLSMSFDIIKVAEAIRKQHPGFDKDKLNILWEKAFEAAEEMDETTSELKMPHFILKEWLKFTEVFHGLGNVGFKNRALNKALDLAKGFENDLERIRAWRQIAECCRKTEDNVGVIGTQLLETLFLIGEKKLQDSIPANLELAYMHFYDGQYAHMMQTFRRFEELFNSGIPTVKAATLSSLVGFILAVEKSDEVPEFKTFRATSFINSAYQSLADFQEEMRPEERANFFLKIVDACELVEDKDIAKTVLGAIRPLVPKCEDLFERARLYTTLARHYKSWEEAGSVNEAVNMALAEIRELPETNDAEIKTKQELLEELLYSCSPEEARGPLQLLEWTYRKVSPERFRRGMAILRLYNEKNMVPESNVFFNHVLVDFGGSNDEAFEKIRLVVNELHLVADTLSPKSKKYFESATVISQTTALLQAAERLLPQVYSKDRNRAIQKLADGYLLVDRQKAQQLLEGVENKHAMRHLAAATAAAIALGAMYYHRDSVPAPLAALALTMF